jgi:hypothetical protein
MPNEGPLYSILSLPSLPSSIIIMFVQSEEKRRGLTPYNSRAASPAAAMAPAPASKRMAALVTWSSPVVELLGPTGVFVGGEMVPMEVMTVGLMIGTV